MLTVSLHEGIVQDAFEFKFEPPVDELRSIVLLQCFLLKSIVLLQCFLLKSIVLLQYFLYAICRVFLILRML